MSQLATKTKDITFIAENTTLSSSISTDSDVTVEGTIEGEIICAHLIIGPTGVIKGAASVKSAEILGQVGPQLAVENLLALRHTGRIDGKFSYGEIEVEKGGILLGSGETSATGPRTHSSPPLSIAYAPQAGSPPNQTSSLLQRKSSHSSASVSTVRREKESTAQMLRSKKGRR
jgi:cytoskeletal protein CcmA (bactofilin family)